MTTLEDLKQAISSVTAARKRYTEGESIQTNLWATVAERNAWRTAFEWHVSLIKRHAALSEEVGAHLTDWIAIDREEEEGMALIREKLS
jgi:hypothetical protein